MIIPLFPDTNLFGKNEEHEAEGPREESGAK